MIDHARLDESQAERTPGSVYDTETNSGKGVWVREMYCKFMGGLSGGVVLSQLMHYSCRFGKGHDWFYRCTKDWAADTFLSETTIRKFLNKLQDLGFVEIRTETTSTGGKLNWYRVNEAHVRESVGEFLVESGYADRDSVDLSSTTKLRVGIQPCAEATRNITPPTRNITGGTIYKESDKRNKGTGTQRVRSFGPSLGASPEYHSPGYAGFEVVEEESEQAASPEDEWAASASKKLYDALAQKNRITKVPSLHRWAQHFLRLLRAPNNSIELIDEVLSWYIDGLVSNEHDQFTPQVFAAVSFVEKFPKLLTCYERQSSKNREGFSTAELVKQVCADQEARAAARRRRQEEADRLQEQE